MNIAYAFKNFEASDHLKEYARRRLEKLGRFFGKSAGLEVNVVMTVDKIRYNCEVTVVGEGLHLKASEQTSDMYAAIDLVTDKLESQIRRHRTKLEKRIRTAELEPVIEAPVYEEQNYDIVRTKKFAVKPMSVEDAITQMELLGHDFFLFLNEESETMNVLYRRHDGSYGLLQPDI